MKRILQEPLLHFLLIGAGLFLYFGAVEDGQRSDGDREIVVSAGRIEQLALIFAKTWQRPPTPTELEGLVDAFVIEEVYYRQAKEMGLDRDDTIIRRRLKQKLQFLTDDAAEMVRPTDAELETYLAENADVFRDLGTFTFEQAFFNPERHGDDTEAHVSTQLAAARAGEIVGDPSLLPSTLTDAPPREVDGTFGPGFSQTLDTIEAGNWQGPVRSGLGLHIVRISARTPGRLPLLAEIRPAVEREYMNEKRNEIRSAVNARLLEDYDVTVEWPGAPADGDAGSEPQ